MKIVKVDISNIRSFKHHNNGYDSIKFGIDKLNLIIGPNGAGKSNLMEIIARIFSNIFNVDYGNGDGDLNRLIAVNGMPTIINTDLVTPPSLTKNRRFKNSPSVIKLKIKLEQSDIDNLNQVNSAKEILKNIDNRLYQVNGSDSYKNIFDHLGNIPEIPTTYEIILSDEATMHNQNRSYSLVSPENIAYWYLRSYHMLRNAIDNYNDYLRPELFTQIQQNNPSYNYEAALDSVGIDANVCIPIVRFNPLLQILSVQERLNEVTLDYTPIDTSLGSNNRENKQRSLERQANMRSFLGGINTAQSMTFEFIKELILRKCLEEISTNKTVVQVVTEINSSYTVLQELNNQLEWFGIKVMLDEFDVSRLYIRLKMIEGNHEADVIDLSSGQKAIVNIASAIALTKVTDAVVIIDEIENHLHPGVQSKLQKMLLNGGSTGSQIIAVTHSPVFIDSSTLKYTYRVHNENGYSNITECGSAFNSVRSKDLEVILNYTNGARIFFTNKVLLVEGISDELFFRAYLNRRVSGSEIEVLNVGGDTGRMLPWRNLIETLGVKVFQINDLDQAYDTTNPRPVLLTPRIRGQGLLRSHFSPTDLARIDQTIQDERSHNRIHLKHGSLEEYYTSSIIRTKRNKPDRVIDFLSSGDWTRVNHDDELNIIVGFIEGE